MIRFRDLTRLGKATAGLVLLVCVGLALALTAHWWDSLTAGLPWSDESRLDRAEARLDQTRAELATREAEIAALERQAEQSAAAHQSLAQARAVTVRATTLAETAPDATDPIDPVRADRLRDADRRLCELSPDLCSGPARQPAADGA